MYMCGGLKGIELLLLLHEDSKHYYYMRTVNRQIITQIWQKKRRLTFILKPALALASINMTFSSRDLASPSSVETCL